MCGRYYVDAETAKEIERLVKNLDEDVKKEITGQRRDIYPSAKAPVIVGKGEEFAAELCTWGFLSHERKGLVFNARSETVFEKRMFRDSIRSRRCMIPVSGFYEWNQDKEKFTFRHKEGKVMYLAGCYREYGEEKHFVILTAPANASMEPVHERMPVVLKPEQLEGWLWDEAAAEAVLSQKMPELLRETEYEQQRLELF